MRNIIERFKKESIVAVLIFIVFAFGFNIYRVQGDGEYYYAFTERVLNVSDPESAANLREKFFFQSGCSFFNIPFYLTGYLTEKAFPHKPNFNGITLRSIAINLASNFYMILSLILAFRILEILKFRCRLMAVLAVLFSTSAFVVSVVMPSYAHSVDIFLITFFVYLMLTSIERNSYWAAFLSGAVYSIAITVRYFNFVLIIPFMVILVARKEYKKWGSLLLGILSTIWLLPFLVNYYSQGYLFPQNSTIVRLPWYPKNFFKSLVHPVHGLFVWSPVTMLSLLGLIGISDSREKLKGWLMVWMWIILVAIYGLVPWDGGWSFSNRYLVGLFPVYVIGLSYFLDTYGKVAKVITIVATFYSIFLFFNWYICIIHGQWGTPLDMLRAWMTGEAPYFSGKTVNLNIFLQRIFNLCRYKYIFKLFI